MVRMSAHRRSVTRHRDAECPTPSGDVTSTFANTPTPPQHHLVTIGTTRPTPGVRRHRGLGAIRGRRGSMVVMVATIALFLALLATPTANAHSPSRRHSSLDALTNEAHQHQHQQQQLDQPLPSDLAVNGEVAPPPAGGRFTPLSVDAGQGLTSTTGASSKHRGSIAVPSYQGKATNFTSETGSFTPNQTLPDGWDPDATTVSSSSGAAPYVVPIWKTLGMWSFRCCSGCNAQCGGKFVHRVCLNRTTEVVIDSFACSKIPAVPVDSYFDWALENCSQVGCSTWQWDGTYNLPTLACGNSSAWSTAKCIAPDGTTSADGLCWPTRRPEPVIVAQQACGNAVPLLPFRYASSAAPFEARTDSAVIAINTTLFVVGGLLGPTLPATNDLADVWRSEDYGQAWVNVPVTTSTFTAIRDHTLQTIGNDLIVIGGITTLALPSTHVWRSSDGGQSWMIVGYLSNGRAQHDSVAFLKGIVVVGGYSLTAIKNDVLYSTDAAHWYLQTSAAPWAPRTYPSIEVVQDTLILCGGRLDTSEAATDVWRTWDMVSWTLVTQATPWAARVGFVLYSTRRNLVVMGGVDDSGGEYYDDQWISADSGLTWQLRTVSPTSSVPSPGLSVLDSDSDDTSLVVTTPRTFSKRAYAANAKMSGDRLVVLGGGYMKTVLNDVWLGSMGSLATDLGTDDDYDRPDSSTSSVGPGGFITVAVCLAAAGLFLTCVTIVLCRHARVNREEKAARREQEAISMQQVGVEMEESVSSGNGEDEEDDPEPEPVRYEIVSPANATTSHQASRGEGEAPPAIVFMPILSPDRGAANGGRTSGSSGSNGGGSRSRSSRSPGATPLSPHAAALEASTGRRRSAGALAAAGGHGHTMPSFTRKVTPSQAPGGGGASGGRHGRSSASNHRTHSVSLTTPNPQGNISASVSASGTPRGTPRGTHRQLAGAGGADNDEIISPHGVGMLPSPAVSSSAAAPLHLHPLYVSSSSSGGMVSVPLGTPCAPPFAVDPDHLAWMQAQISYQASLLAAVVTAQRGNAASPSPASPAVQAEVPEEYFRSVPQLSSQQAQLLFVGGSPVPVAFPSASAAAGPRDTADDPLEEFDDELQPGQSDSDGSPPVGSATDLARGFAGHNPSQPTMLGVSSSIVAATPPRRLSTQLPAIKEGEAD